MKKKGVLVIQFNWIYVIIIGGLILSLFVGIAARQKTAAEKTAFSELNRRLETALANSISSPDTTNTVDMGKAKITFDCAGFSVGEISPFSPGVSFAPSRITTSGKQLITWTKSFDAPFKVTNFLYVTSKQARYILIGSSALADMIEESLPEDLTLERYEELSDFSTIKYKNEDKTRIIVVDLNGELELDNSFMEADVSAVKITSSYFDFYEKRYDSLELFPQGTSPYNGVMPIVYGAIFTDSLETFECSIDKANNKLALISRIFADRAELLRKQYEGTSCEDSYENSIYWFLSAKNDITSARTNLQSINRALQINSCPLLY